MISGMIPRLDVERSLRPELARYVERVRSSGYEGEITGAYAARVAVSTDNSVYQFTPEAVATPRGHDDVVRLLAPLADDEFASITVAPRGGGTGTNGQSLTTGIMVDTSRHLNRVLDLDASGRRARVQPGVTLDQLNDAAGPHGLMFAPTVSTSNRATIGGMIATDAAGKGSRIYGKTSGHLIELTVVLVGGDVCVSRALDADELERICGREDAVGRLYRTVASATAEHVDEIDRVFPDLTRYMSGYNLKMVRDNPDGRFNLNYLLAGSEGTLGFTTEALVRLTPIPKHTKVVVLKYASFDDALGSAKAIAPTEPAAVETMDDKLLDLVKTDESYLPVAPRLENGAGAAAAINLVEYAGDDAAAVEGQAAGLVATVEAARGEPGAPIGAAALADETEAAAFWALRKRSVGLLGNLPGPRKPQAFVEDAAIPPEKLRDFVREFRALLDAHDLRYGMFGHVDVGVLHVRPALDLKNDEDVALIRTISDASADLVRRYGGVLWGEHGKGVRGEFNEMFFGPTLYRAMRAIKGAADPRGQLNPGKIAAPLESEQTLLTIESTTRGVFDREIDAPLLDRFDDAVRCNGNAHCHSDNRHDIMCPSWKETRDRIHTPKGRASLMREWLRRLSLAGADWRPDTPGRTNFIARRINQWRGGDDFSHEVYDAMHGCLACKACAGQCPVKVDVPDFRAEFLQAYHDRYPRRLRDRLVGGLESMLPRTAIAPRVSNTLTQLGPARRLLRSIGLVDAPPLATPTLKQRLRRDPARRFDVDSLNERTVVVLQDAFTTFYTPETIVATLDVIRDLGFRAAVAPYFPNGKALHVKGFTRKFAAVAKRNSRTLERYAATGATLIGVDPAVTLTYRDEYVKAVGAGTSVPPVRMLQEWLGEVVGDRRPASSGRDVRLLGHCTERSVAPASMREWTRVFEALGATCEIVSAGCCGMCGAYGHEAEHAAQSRGIYDRSWAVRLAEPFEGETVTTGYSCRAQVNRFDGRALRHPIEVVRELIDET